MRKILFFLLAFCLFSGGQLLAQPTVGIASQTACSGDTALVGIHLNTAGQAIGAASLVIQWDSTTSFQGLVNVLPAFAPDFSWQQQGRTVRISWFSTTARTLNGLWFQLRFSGGSSALLFSAIPGDNELADAQGVPLAATGFLPGQLSFNAGTPVQISSNPRDTLVTVGAQVSFQLIASNVTGYQWERSTDGGNNWTLLTDNATYSNTTTATLSVNNVLANMHGHRFRARLSNNCQSLVLSQSAILSVQQMGSTIISLTANPVCGQDTALINVQAGAALNGVGAISMVLLFDSTQAQFVSISSPISGINNGLLTNRVGNRLFVSWFNTNGVNITAGTFLQIRFRNVTGGMLNFDQNQPGNNEISNLSGIAFPLTLGSLQLQSSPTPQAVLNPTGTINSCAGVHPMLSANTGTGWTYRWLRNNGPLTGATASTLTIVSSGSYRVIITNAAGCFDTSAATTVNLSAAINAQITAAGPTTFCIGGRVVLNGTTGTGYSYSWLLNGSAISGATTSSYTATTSGSYRLRIQNSANCVDTSAPVQLTVLSVPPAVITPAGPTTFCQGGSVTLQANIVTGIGYQWLRNGAILTGSTGSSLVATLAGSYQVILSGGSCSDTSAITTVTVNTSPTAQITPAGPTTLCNGGSVVLNANTGAGLTYLWLLNGVAISGANAASYTAMLAGNYRVRVTAVGGCSDTSAVVAVIVGNSPSASITPSGPTSFCQGGTLTLNANTGTGLSYQWLRNGLLLTGSTGASLQVTLSGDYRVIVSIGTCSDTSTNTTVVVNPFPNAQITPAGPTSFCIGGSVVLNGTTGSGFSYSWLLNGAPIPGANSASFTATVSGSYRLLIQNSAGCVDTSAAVQVNVVTAPSATITPAGPTTFCQGNSVTLNANTGTGFSYLWLRNGSIITGATSASITAVLAGDYRVIVSLGSCVDTSATTTVIVNPSPSAQLTATGPTTFCSGGSVVLNATTGTGLSYAWLLNGTVIIGANTASFNATSAGSYRVVISAIGGCLDTSAAIVVVVNSSTVATISAGGPTSFCPGGSVTLNANTGTGLIYLWQRNGTTITGANTASIQATLAGDYRVIVSTTSGCADTSSITTITLLSLPTAQITAGGPTTFCSGDSVVLNANTASGLSYSWLLNDTILPDDTSASLVVRISGNYKLRVTNSGGCIATSAATTVTATPLPPAPALSVSTDTIFSSVSAGLLWFRNGLLLAGLNDSILIVTQPGHYTALSIIGSCQSDSSNVIIIDNVSVENLHNLQFRLYPNPTTGQFYVDFEVDGLKSTELRVYSLQGKLIQEIILPAGTAESRFELQLHAAAGLYIIELLQGDKKGYQRLILKN